MSAFSSVAVAFEDLLHTVGSSAGTTSRSHQTVLAHLRALNRLDDRIIELTFAAVQSMEKDCRRLLQSAGALPSELHALRISNLTVASTGPLLVLPDSESADIFGELEVIIPSFYDRAHQLIKLLEAFPWYGKAGGRRILVVRNQLIVHAGEGSSNRAEWSFGVTMHEGPQVRPLRFGSTPPSHLDAGYLTNRTELLQDLYAGLSRNGVRMEQPHFPPRDLT